MMLQLPQYRCHKIVGAARIIEASVDDDGQGTLLLDIPGQPLKHRVTVEWMDIHGPEVGGFFVQYQDGYCSYSPATAFEEGYHLQGPSPLDDIEPLAGRQWGNEDLARLAVLNPGAHVAALVINQVAAVLESRPRPCLVISKHLYD
jgi:hypothetical protein